MPNWCYTSYRFNGDEENLYKLNEDIDKLSEDNKTLFVVDIIDSLKLKVPDGANLRGHIIYNDVGMIETESAWNPCEDFINALCDKYDLTYLYFAEEPGCIGYWSNDIDNEVFDTKYIVYDCESEEEQRFGGPVSDEELKKGILEWLNLGRESRCQSKFKTFEEASGDDNVSITEVEYTTE